MSIYKDNKIVEENGIKATLHYYGDPDEYEEFRELIDNWEIGELFKKCYVNADTFYSTTNYKEQCIVFAKVYQDNWEELDRQVLENRNKKLKKQLEEIQRRLEDTYVLPDISYDVESPIKEEIKTRQQFVDSYNKQLKDYKEGSTSYDKCVENIERHQKQIDYLQDFLKNLREIEL